MLFTGVVGMINTYLYVFGSPGVAFARRRFNGIQFDTQNVRQKYHVPARRTPRLVVEINRHFNVRVKTTETVNLFGSKNKEKPSMSATRRVIQHRKTIHNLNLYILAYT